MCTTELSYSSYIKVKGDRSSLISSSPQAETGKILFQYVRHTENKNKMSAIHSCFLLLLRLTRLGREPCLDHVSIQNARVLCGQGLLSPGTVLPSSTKLGDRRPEKTYKTRPWGLCTLPRHLLLFLTLLGLIYILMYCEIQNAENSQPICLLQE